VIVDGARHPQHDSECGDDAHCRHHTDLLTLQLVAALLPSIRLTDDPRSLQDEIMTWLGDSPGEGPYIHREALMAAP